MSARRPIYWCQAPDCPNRLTVNSNAKPLVLKSEYHAAWALECPVCRNIQIHTKDLVGGTLGQGRRNDFSGTTTSKGGSKWRPGVSFTP